MMHYSLHLANWYTQHGYDLYGRSDLRFLQELYRVSRPSQLKGIKFNYLWSTASHPLLSVLLHCSLHWKEAALHNPLLPLQCSLQLLN